MDDTDWDGLIARRERLLNEALLGKRAHEQVRQSRLQRGEACIHCGHFPEDHVRLDTPDEMPCVLSTLLRCDSCNGLYRAVHDSARRELMQHDWVQEDTSRLVYGCLGRLWCVGGVVNPSRYLQVFQPSAEYEREVAALRCGGQTPKGEKG
jgi:hypothetical protein